MTERPQLLTLTEAAIERIRHLVDREGASGRSLRIGVKTQGCSGLSYHVEFAAAPGPADAMVEAGGVTVYVDPKATLYLLGSRMDYVEDRLKSGFVFSNPNEKARCGCGESFHV
jgi:iron-sulfur cluster assembly protein